jgi:hypothetical protein
MKRAATLTEAIVVVAVLITLIGLFKPAISAAIAAVKMNSEPAVPRAYTIRLTRPDGCTHRTYTIQSIVDPVVITYPNEHGCLRVRSRRLDRASYTQPFPAGWLVEVEPKVEDDK